MAERNSHTWGKEVRYSLVVDTANGWERAYLSEKGTRGLKGLALKGSN